MVRCRRVVVVMVVLSFALSLCAPLEAGVWSSFKSFCKKLFGPAVHQLESAVDSFVDNFKPIKSLVDWVVQPLAMKIIGGNKVQVTDPATGKSKTVALKPDLLAKLQKFHFIGGCFELTGKTYGEEKIFSFYVDNPGEVSCRIAWTGAPRLAMILNGPGQTGYYDRIDGDSPLEFGFTVTPELAKKGRLWRISIKDFSKSGKASSVTIAAFTPRGIGETLSAATADQRVGYAEEDMRNLAARVRDLESQLKIEKQFSRGLAKQISDLRHRMNAIDKKDVGRGKACPFFYTLAKDGTTWVRRGEVMRNLVGPDMQRLETTGLGRFVTQQDGVVSVMLREEKAEISFVDYVALEVNGRTLTPRCDGDEVGALTARDGAYLILEQGQDVRLDFVVGAGVRLDGARLAVDGYYVHR